jgi:catechol 2,3-dioxygenase-like lactoylglutathione lyase family enzyme
MRRDRARKGVEMSTTANQSLSHVSAISLFVEELHAAKSFYEEVFGVEVVYEDDTSVCVKFDQVFVNLLLSSAARQQVEPAPVASPDSGSRFQLSIWVDDVDAACAALEERGVNLLTGPVDREWGMRVATFTDPDGHNWELAQELAR